MVVDYYIICFLVLNITSIFLLSKYFDLQLNLLSFVSSLIILNIYMFAVFFSDTLNAENINIISIVLKLLLL